MCTLIVGNGILGAGTVMIAANRDESPARLSESPRVLCEMPRVVGGRDRVAGGTWLAVRERRAVVALLNRRDRPATASTTTSPMTEPRSMSSSPGGPAGELRSRGLLALDVAAVPEESRALSAAALDRALAAVGEHRYAPFSLVFLAPDAGWLLVHDASGPPVVTPIATGWHVVTHANLDDPDEPRTRRLIHDLERWTPATLDEAATGLHQRLSLHADAAGPAVCIHEGPMVTVSSSLVCLTRDAAHYRHLEGRPCEHAFSDRSALLAGGLALAAVE